MAAGWQGSAAADSFDECHLIDLPERRDPSQHALDRGFTQRAHALLARGLLDFGVRPPGKNDFTDVIGQIEQLAYGCPPLVPRTPALDAPRPFEKEPAVGETGVHGRLDELLARHLGRALAVGADIP